jgi:hypothetical protein
MCAWECQREVSRASSCPAVELDVVIEACILADGGSTAKT